MASYFKKEVKNRSNKICIVDLGSPLRELFVRNLGFAVALSIFRELTFRLLGVQSSFALASSMPLSSDSYPFSLLFSQTIMCKRGVSLGLAAITAPVTPPVFHSTASVKEGNPLTAVRILG